jgi:hypothetical protein
MALDCRTPTLCSGLDPEPMCETDERAGRWAPGQARSTATGQAEVIMLLLPASRVIRGKIGKISVRFEPKLLAPREMGQVQMDTLNLRRIAGPILPSSRRQPG